MIWKNCRLQRLPFSGLRALHFVLERKANARKVKLFLFATEDNLPLSNPSWSLTTECFADETQQFL